MEESVHGVEIADVGVVELALRFGLGGIAFHLEHERSALLRRRQEATNSGRQHRGV